MKTNSEPNNQILTNAERNRARSEYKKTHPNGKISAALDENDRSIIKTFCEVNLQPLRSVVDLAKNDCTIYCNHEGQELILGKVRKIVYKKTFEVLIPFKLYITRTLKPGQKPQSEIIKAGTIVHTSEDFNHIWVPVSTNEGWLKVERWIITKNTTLRQVRSLMLINEEEGIGMGEEMDRIDLVELMTNFKHESSNICQSRINSNTNYTS